jgi:hypothetical protein
MPVKLPAAFDANGHGVPHYTEVFQLDGVTFTLQFDWNSRASSWYMSIYDGGGTLLAAGRRLTCDFPPLARFHDRRMPAGLITVVDTSGQQLDPGIDDLGARVVLLYFTYADVAAIQAGTFQ